MSIIPMPFPGPAYHRVHFYDGSRFGRTACGRIASQRLHNTPNPFATSCGACQRSEEVRTKRILMVLNPGTEWDGEEFPV